MITDILLQKTKRKKNMSVISSTSFGLMKTVGGKCDTEVWDKFVLTLGYWTIKSSK